MGVPKGSKLVKSKDSLEVVRDTASRLLAHFSVFFSFIFMGYLINKVFVFTGIQSDAVFLAFRVVQYAFIFVGLLFAFISLIREAFRLLMPKKIPPAK